MDKKKIELIKENNHIWTVNDVNEGKFLLKKVSEFAYADYSKKDIDLFVKHMRKMMVSAHGIGLSANQIGLPYRLFVAQLPSKDGKGYVGKFYAIINPVITFASAKKIADQEGCLSIPYTYGIVDRAEKITIEGLDKNGRMVTLKVEGLLARIFQHETDHLHGILFTSKARDVFKVEPPQTEVQP